VPAVTAPKWKVSYSHGQKTASGPRQSVMSSRQQVPVFVGGPGTEWVAEDSQLEWARISTTGDNVTITATVVLPPPPPTPHPARAAR